MVQELDIKKLDSKSLDVAETDKERLKAVFPQCFVEGKLDIDKLLSLCGEYIDNDFEKYKFEWKGKSECYRIAGKRSTGTLRPCPEESVDFENTNNLYIEGDNLEVLKLLQTAYYRKVKMIYIDPPYNTGNDFVYEDDFKDPLAKYKEITSQTTKSNPETMGRYHTNWLNMMYPRLRLAANLLRDDGVIFISIDDNEVTNLRRLCDEVFGEENFVAQVIVQTNPRGRTFDRFIAKTHEYLLVYTKNIDIDGLHEVPKDDKAISEYSKEDEHGKYRLLELRNRNPVFNRSNRPLMFYPLYADPNKLDVSLTKTDRHTVEIYPRNSQGEDGCWTWGLEKATNYTNLLVANHASTGKWSVFRKDYLEGTSLFTKSKALWLEKEMNHENGKEMMGKLFGKTPFDFPKSVEYIKKCLQLGTFGKDPQIVLDFFSGSATTAHAVMQLNAEDGGKRQFIMVQLPELTDNETYKNICEIGKERIRRAGAKIQKEMTEKVVKETGQSETLLDLGMVSSFNTGNKTEATYKDGVAETFSKNGTKQVLTDVGFKVLKLDTSNLVKWDDTPLASTDTADLFNRMDGMIESIKKGRSELDVVYEVMLKLGIPATYQVFENNINGRKVYSIGDDGLILICLDGSNGGITPEDVTAMCELAPAKIVAAEEAFKDDVALSNAFYISKDSGVEIMLL
jgi:site-specific DNA-methyltransferase (adenine-specific)